MNTVRINYGIRPDDTIWVSINGPAQCHSQFDWGGILEQLMLIKDQQIELDRLQALVTELEKDKARLDWLDLNQKSIIHDCEAVHDAWCAGLQGERQNTIRKAIDIEMEQSK